MTKNQSFADFCKERSVWIIEYKSIKNEMHFFIWFNDSYRRTRFLTWHSGKIFSTASIAELASLDDQLTQKFNLHESVRKFLLELKNFETYSYNSFDVQSILHNLEENFYDEENLAWCTDLIYLVKDYIVQSYKIEHLLPYFENAEIQAVFKYFHDEIIWKKIEEKDKFDINTIPRLDIDVKKLVEALKELTAKFELEIQRENP